MDLHKQFKEEIGLEAIIKDSNDDFYKINEFSK